MPDELWIEDLQILRDLGCNFIRGCHYPQSQRFLDLCDQLGFLVWEESLGWGDSVEVQSDPKFRRAPGRADGQYGQGEHQPSARSSSGDS